MKKSEIANWLLFFYLGTSVILGAALIILGPQNSWLGLSDNFAEFAIVIPVFLGQLAFLFRWFVSQATNTGSDLEETVNISSKLIKMPALIVIGIFLLAILLRGLGINNNWSIQIDETQFRNLITFGMSILNATTIYLAAIFYKNK